MFSSANAFMKTIIKLVNPITNFGKMLRMLVNPDLHGFISKLFVKTITILVKIIIKLDNPIMNFGEMPQIFVNHDLYVLIGKLFYDNHY